MAERKSVSSWRSVTARVCIFWSKTDPIFIAFFGVIHRNIGIAQNVFRRFIFGISHRYSDAETRKNLSAVQGKRRGNFFFDAFRKFNRIFDIGKFIQNKSKFIAAESRHQIFFPNGSCQTFGNVKNKPVADRMSETVVDSFETVDVEK